MIQHLLRRLGWSLFTIWAVVTATFLIYNVLPEDPARVIAGPQARPADVARIRTQLGLDRPVHVRYWKYMSGLVRFGKGDEKDDTSLSLGPVRIDLGVSYLKRKPVVALLGKALPPTLLVGILAIAIQVAIGAVGGVIAAMRRHTVFDWGTVALTLVGISAPTFLTGLLLQHFMARELMLFPLDGYGQTAAEKVHAALLPAITLGLFGAAYYTRLVRDEMITLLKQDYIRTARAKGQREWIVVLKHALRNALMPLVTVVGLSMGTLVGGAIVTEKIFRWPGIGALSVDAIVERDGPVIMGVVILFSTVVVLANLLVDLSYALLDPRIRKR
ncbi:MAG: ABC transporter permease [Myxococcales bacterium]|nr:ABC transporter permease [Myxococcales bacterium]MCB9577250.1 ABC transporter permease [Polyangiaceae bacterium]